MNDIVFQVVVIVLLLSIFGMAYILLCKASVDLQDLRIKLHKYEEIERINSRNPKRKSDYLD